MSKHLITGWISMYDFAFYFIYRVLLRKNNDTVFTATLLVFILIGIHLLAAAGILSYYGVIGEIPVFSKTYLYNKLAWYPFLGILLLLVIRYFNKKKVKAILDKYSDDDAFYSFKNFIFFLIIVTVPIILLVKYW